jgi:hypothetical protein
MRIWAWIAKFALEIRVEQSASASGKHLKVCVSNHAHIVALAKASGARVVFSNDGNLHKGIRNATLVAKPRGRIYQTPEHQHLLGNDVPVGASARSALLGSIHALDYSSSTEFRKFTSIDAWAGLKNPCVGGSIPPLATNI